MMKHTYSVSEFCQSHGIGRTHLYQLLKDGQGPRVMHVGRRILISAEAAADWRRQMEGEAASDSLRAAERSQLPA